MFKKFVPKEDVSTSTSIKSSIQRAIRLKLTTQYALLSAPAVPLPPRVVLDSEGEEEDEEEDELVVREFGKGKQAKQDKLDKKGRGGKKDKKGGSKASAPVAAPVEEEVEESKAADEDEVLTLLDVLWPKKEGITLIKCREHLSILALHGEPLFFQHFDGPYFPTLKILHKYPNLLPRVQVDRGAIKFVLSGANIMCPGLTSATAALPKENVPVGQPVGVYAAGKTMALGIGLTAMSTDDIRLINKNCGVENICYLGDDLWTLKSL